MPRSATSTAAAPVASSASSPGHTLTDQAYARLYEALMNGVLLPEQTLTVRDIASQYGVSLTPVREALQRLVAERALAISGRTFQVPRLDIETYREILKIRLDLEDLAGREAAARISNEEITRLDGVVAQHVAAIRAGDALATLRANTDFHLSIYRASDLPVLVRIIESLWLRIGPTMNLLFPQYCGSLVGHEIHKTAMTALHRRDGIALGRAMRDDLIHGSEFLVRLLRP
ncbi:GntR family transcriptional regulator [Variovorax sp. VNK109]|uniref:GntR family transcriptional regulator n=1 Tax=Variovorax sp. VNK109 TaxID=3400919 RepID=UPI003C09DA5F